MPIFFMRQRTRRLEEVGITERVISLSLLLLTLAVVAIFVLQVVTDRDYLFDVDQDVYALRENRADLPSSAPANTISGGTDFTVEGAEPDDGFPDVSGSRWDQPQRVSRYSRDQLHIKINGRAEAYLQRGVKELVFGAYRDSKDPRQMIDVYRYDMGKPENAQAMYRFEAPPAVPNIPIGREGYQVGGAVFFWAASSYVQVMPPTPGQADADAALCIAEAIAGTLVAKESE